MQEAAEEAAGARNSVRMSSTSGALAKLGRFMPSIRTYIGLTQILNGIQFSFNIIFPPLFTLILDFLKLVSIDIFGALQLGCVGSWTCAWSGSRRPRGSSVCGPADRSTSSPG